MTTPNSIKLKLKNNSRNRLLSSLNNRIYALNTDSCNDYFASCCNCCNGCECCPCVSGFFITVTGITDGETPCPAGTCSDFNGEYFVPVDLNNPYDICSSGIFTAQDATCNAYEIKIEWKLECVNGQLQLCIVFEVASQGNSIIVQGCDYNLSCDNLSGSIPQQNLAVASNEFCDATNAGLSYRVVTGGPSSPVECQCCRDVRCEESDPSCLNPFPDTLFLTLSDNCAGNIILTLNRSGMCWTGTYVTLCTECSPVEYTVAVTFCCDGGVWTFLAVVVSPDSCADTLCWSTNPDLDLSEGCSPMDKPNCDPITASSDIPNQTVCGWYTCPPQEGPYNIFNWQITEI